MGSPERKDLLRPLQSRPKTPGKKETRERSDRFIANRGATNRGNFLERVDTGGSDFKASLAQQLSLGDSNRVLQFKSSKGLAAAPSAGTENACASPALAKQASRPTRVLPSAPDSVLDAPELLLDFYVNILDWSSAGMLAIALGPVLYLWDKRTGDVTALHEFDDSVEVTAVKWNAGGNLLGVGMSDHTVLIFDVAKGKQVRVMRGHTGRVCCLSWAEATLSSAGASGVVHNSDVREKAHLKAALEFHSKKVCSLAWSPERDQLASGANDHLVALWDHRKTDAPGTVLSQHTAAVKGLAWCPWQRRTIATGGGSGDHMIRFWDARAERELATIDAASPVSGLLWNPHEKEIVAGLGFPDNKLALWKWPTCKHIADFKKHEDRVLFLALDPDGETVCSGGADQILCFWKMFAKPQAKRNLMGVSRSNGQSAFHSVIR